VYISKRTTIFLVHRSIAFVLTMTRRVYVAFVRSSVEIVYRICWIFQWQNFISKTSFAQACASFRLPRLPGCHSKWRA